MAAPTAIESWNKAHYVWSKHRRMMPEANASAFAKLGAALDAADVKREGMVATSFDVALSRLNRSYRSDSQYEHVVDLATALEAALIGSDKTKDEITLRLRTRAAALLATPADPAEAVFEDVGRLYDLRSKLNAPKRCLFEEPTRCEVSAQIV